MSLATAIVDRLKAGSGQSPAAAVAVRASSPPIEFHPSYLDYFGPGIGSQPSPETLLRESIGVAARSTRAIANRVAGLNPQVKVSRRTRAGTVEDEILDDHPLKLLIDRPHPDLSRSQMSWLITHWIVTCGVAHWLKVGNGYGLPTELHPIPPGNITPMLSQNVIAGYLITTGDGARFPIERERVVRFYFPDPESYWTAEGYLGPAALTADTLKFSGEHIRSHYQHDASPKSVLKALENAESFTPEQQERFWAMWRKHYHNRSGTNRGVPGILPTGYDLIQIVAQSGADIVPLLEFLRDENLMDFGVPRSVLGQVVSGDRSSAEVNQWVFDKYTVQPITNLIAETLTLQLAPDFDTSLFVEYEKFVADDKEFILRQETADLQNKVRSPQQIIRDRGGDPEDAPWGELPVANIGQIPYDPDMLYDFGDGDQPEALGADETANKEEPRSARTSNGGARPDPAAFGSKEAFMAACIPQVMAEGKTNEQAVGQCNGMWENRSRCRSNADYFHPEAEWQRQLNREKKYVPTMSLAVKRVFGIHERAIIKALKSTQPRSRVTAEELYAGFNTEVAWEKHVEPIREKAFEAILGETLEGFGIEDFVLTDEMRFLLRQQAALLVKHADRTTQNMIADQLEKGTAEGESVDQLAKRIRRVFQTRRAHSKTIARTEILKTSQEAQVAGFETSGVVEGKQWNTSLDGHVRDEHQAMEAVSVGLRDPFQLPSGELADGPGVGYRHGQLSAGNAINCRCFLTPVRNL